MKVVRVLVDFNALLCGGRVEDSLMLLDFLCGGLGGSEGDRFGAVWRVRRRGGREGDLGRLRPCSVCVCVGLTVIGPCGCLGAPFFDGVIGVSGAGVLSDMGLARG